jgi:hypothetical protein
MKMNIWTIRNMKSQLRDMKIEACHFAQFPTPVSVEMYDNRHKLGLKARQCMGFTRIIRRITSLTRMIKFVEETIKNAPPEIDEDEDLLKRGQWLTCFMNKLEDEQKMERIVAGVYPTAQEAYMRAQDYGDEDFWKTPPEMLVLELLGPGVYPDCLEVQVVFNWIDQMGYVDMEGVTRPSYMLRQGLAEVIETHDGIAVVG